MILGQTAEAGTGAGSDGTMARGAQIDAYAARHGLPLLSIEDLVAWRRRGDATARL
ncbi:MAG: hypothetical protein U1F49_04940 [Rubrivivax sp.]